jgi:hypothetical protein
VFFERSEVTERKKALQTLIQSGFAALFMKQASYYPPTMGDKYLHEIHS